MAARKDYFVVLLTIFFLVSVSCLPEPGKKVLRFDTVSGCSFLWLNCCAEFNVFRLQMLKRSLVNFDHVVFSHKIKLIFIWHNKRIDSV